MSDPINAAYEASLRAAAAAGWPYPGDSVLARARRVGQAYRARLHDADPDACAELDRLMAAWGQTWVVPRAQLHDLDDWVGPTEAADLAAVDPAQLRVWRRRGRITGRQRADRSWEYRVRDVMALLADVRHRTGEATTP
jgi:hypothetical protein